MRRPAAGAASSTASVTGGVGTASATSAASTGSVTGTIGAASTATGTASATGPGVPGRSLPPGWPDQPVLYEVNALVWLRDLAGRAGGPLTLGEVPPGRWDELAPPGVDAVWLMGVWERSPASRQTAWADRAQRRQLQAVLPDLAAGDVVGSAYAVRRYEVDERLGGRAGLAAARAELARRGVRLVLDYVPNHVAPDHPWVGARPELFVAGSAADLARAPDSFGRVGGGVLAFGRDPNLPPWRDVVQLDAFSPATRAAAVETLVDIGRQCDGVRCDMAMLVLNRIFARTWGRRVGPAPAGEFWREVIGRVRTTCPGLLFLAEAYWDTEPELLAQGFDCCYDKRLYDALRAGDVTAVRRRLARPAAEQRRGVRFCENHDEARAAVAFAPPVRERATAVTIATLPGATLWHEGQFEGRRARVPVFLARRPAEPPDDRLRAFSAELVDRVAASGMRTGEWQLIRPLPRGRDSSCRNLLAWGWRRPVDHAPAATEAGRAAPPGSAFHAVVVNLSDARAAGRIRLPWAEIADGQWTLRALLGPTEQGPTGVAPAGATPQPGGAAGFARPVGDAVPAWDGARLTRGGLPVELDPWGFLLLAAEPVVPTDPS